MDWDRVVEGNAKRLQRILAMLVAMAGPDATLTSPLWGGRRKASGGGSDLDNTPTRRSDDPRPPHKGEVETGDRPTLPRRLHRAILRLLRPLESATRRLIIIAARDLPVPILPPSRPREAKPDMKAAHAALRRLGLAVVMSGADIARAAAEKRAAEKRAASRANRARAFPLLDPLKRFGRQRRRYVPAHAAPRILTFDGAVPHKLPPPPSPWDPIDATRLAQRLAGISNALADLPAPLPAAPRLRTGLAQALEGRDQRGPRRPAILRPRGAASARHVLSGAPTRGQFTFSARSLVGSGRVRLGGRK